MDAEIRTVRVSSVLHVKQDYDETRLLVHRSGNGKFQSWHSLTPFAERTHRPLSQHTDPAAKQTSPDQHHATTPRLSSLLPPAARTPRARCADEEPPRAAAARQHVGEHRPGGRRSRVRRVSISRESRRDHLARARPCPCPCGGMAGYWDGPEGEQCPQRTWLTARVGAAAGEGR